MNLLNKIRRQGRKDLPFDSHEINGWYTGFSFPWKKAGMLLALVALTWAIMTLFSFLAKRDAIISKQSEAYLTCVEATYHGSPEAYRDVYGEYPECE